MTTSIKQNEINYWTAKLQNELIDGNEFEINQAEEMLEKLSN